MIGADLSCHLVDSFSLVAAADLPVTLTPRTAAVLSHALAVLADEAYDHVYRAGMCRDGAPCPTLFVRLV
jgi:hypothetical protein